MAKQITPTGTMSNLVGMWAFIWEGDTLKTRVYVRGKADDQHFIIQGINALTGDPNVCKIVKLENMLDWTFYPTIEIANECYDDYCRNNTNRYKLVIPLRRSSALDVIREFNNSVVKTDD